MSQKAIREYDGKGMISRWFSAEQTFAQVAPGTDLDSIPQIHPWINSQKLVVKPDQLIKRRGKSGLIGLNLSWEEAKAWISERRGKEVEVAGLKDVLKYFIVEPFLPHQSTDEHYVCIHSDRKGDWIMFCHDGGVDVGDVDAKSKKLMVPITFTPTSDDIQRDLLTEVPEARRKVVADYISNLFTMYSTLHFAYLEINPLVVTDGPDGPVVSALDLAAKVDEVAHFECQDQWGDLTFPGPFGAISTPEEDYIASLDAKTGASLKLTVLNPKGRVWTMVAGGGASVIYADTIAGLGFSAEMANYGEYSGAPNENMTYNYARTLLDLMTREKHPDGKVLLIGGGIANFTNVAETFKGIVKALREFTAKIKEYDIHIYVRRGGPNYQEGLKTMREEGEKLDLDIQVFGPETHITGIVSKALGKKDGDVEVPCVSDEKIKSLQAAQAKALDTDGRSQSPVPGMGVAPLFSNNTKAIVFGMQPDAVQNMMDFDYLARRPEPSVACMVYNFAAGTQYRQFYWGDKEVMIPVFPQLHQAVQKFPDVSVVVNFASARSAYESTLQVMQVPQIRVIAIIAEGVPEKNTRHLISLAEKQGTVIIGPATVGGVKPGSFRMGNAGGKLDNIVASNLFRPGSVAYVSRSGGLSNELNNILSRTTDGVAEGVAIGGDRFPVTTFIDHLLRFEHDESIKFLVLLGEVGGTLEYEVCEALKDGRITKPLVAWCTGTCASSFSYDVQFGHAGALAQSTFETAAAKNKALKEAGAIVPDSFDDFGECIKLTYEKMKASGLLTPVPDIEPPAIPMDFNWARKLGLIRKPALFMSSICDERGDEVRFSGMPMSELFEKELGIGGTLGLLWFRRELPEYARKFIEMVLVVTADHGPAVSGAHNTIVTTRAGKDLISSLCAGLLTIGPLFGGALDEAGKQFSEGLEKGKTPSEFVNWMTKEQKKRISGIGHKIKSLENPDKRVTIIVEFAKKHFSETQLLDYALEVQKVTTRKKSTLILNVDGAIACAFVDMMRSCGCFSREEVDEYIQNGALNGLFVLGRSMGFIGHHLDQKRLKQDLYRQPIDDITYLVDGAETKGN